MAIIDTIKKKKYRVKTGTSGADTTCDLYYFKTSADMVENSDGTTLQETVGGIKGLTTDIDIASNGYVIDAKTIVSELKKCMVIVSFNPTTKELVTRSYSGT